MARYDKYDPETSGFRAAVAIDYPDADLGKLFGFGINSAGQAVKGSGQTGVIGVMVVTQKPGRVGPQREVRVIDIMREGCITDFGPSTPGMVPGVDFGLAGTLYYSDSYGVISSSPFGPQVQIITITGGPGGGTFTVTYGGQTTSGVAYNASASTLQTALQGLSTIGSGNATVAGSNGGPYTVTFASALAPQSPQIASPLLFTASGASLTGGTSPGVTVQNSSPSTYVGYTVEPDRLEVGVQPLGTTVVTPAQVVDFAAPGSFAAGSVAYNSIPFTWNVVSGASYYVIRIENVSDSGPFSFVPALQGGQPTTNSTTILGLTPNTNYGFQIAAVVNGVIGPFSSTVTATTATL